MKALTINLLLALFLCFITCGRSSENKDKLRSPQIGQLAPLFRLENVLQGPKSCKTSLKDLKGKVIVLEFWATWCMPCLDNIPHLNELAMHFKDNNNVVFISITNESQEVIEKFLKKRKMVSWIGLDTDKHTLKAYNVNGIPKTFVIDSSGKLLYDGRPESLSKEILESILDGKYVPPEKSSTGSRDLKLKYIGFSPGLDPLYYAFTKNYAFTKKIDLQPYLHIIRPALFPGTGPAGGYRTTPNDGVGITINDMSLLKIFSMAFNLSSQYRIVNDAKIDEMSRWDVVFSRTSGYDLNKAWKEIRESMEDVFSVRAVKHEMECEVTVVKVTNASKFIREKDIDRNDPTSTTLKPLGDIIAHFEDKSGGIAIFDEDKSLHIDCFGKQYWKMSVKEFEEWLSSEGLSFSKEKRKVEVLKLLKK